MIYIGHAYKTSDARKTAHSPSRSRERKRRDRMTGTAPIDLEFIQEATRLTAAAKEQKLTLRVMGATAIKIHCPKFAVIHEHLGRSLTDLDFVGRSKETRQLLEMLETSGYLMDRDARYRMALVGRCVLQKHDSSLHVDLFFDQLRWNHTLDLRNRLELDFPTLTVSDLVVEKMQIVKINEKDIKDTIVMLREHSVTDHDRDSVNGPYIAELLAEDWGFYYTFIKNLSTVETFTQKYDQLSQEDKENVRSKIAGLRQVIEDKPKSLRWKLRARTGTNAKWYREVDELT